MKKFNIRKLPKQYFAALVAIFLLVGICIHVINTAIDRSVYQDRKEALHQLVDASASTINESVSSKWDLVDIYANNAVRSLSENNDIDAFLENMALINYSEKDYYFLVDEEGKYYCSDGEYGKIIDTSYYIEDQADKIEYLGNLPHFASDETFLIFRSRLKEKVSVKTANGKANIVYCGLLHSLDELNETVSALFQGKNNTIIFDTDSGLMLYKQFGIRLLIDGYNVYSKYNSHPLKYGDTAEEIIAKVKNKEVTISLMEIDAENFYLCTSPLNVSDWSLIMVVDASYFEANSQSNFKQIAFTISAIIFVLGIAVLTILYAAIEVGRRQKEIEKQEKLNSALQEAYQTKSNFLSYMSHDIRTPINGIIGMSEIGKKSDSKEKADDCFDKIVLSSKHLLALVNDVLDMSALESGKVVMQSASLDLETFLKDCITIIDGSLSDRKLIFKTELNCPVRYIMADELHLRQIIINVLGNAVKYTKDGGTITLRTRAIQQSPEKVTYRFEVEDTGIGMSKEFQKKIFEAFTQEDGGSRTVYKGTGLGMSISYQYVQMMNGTITVQSELNVGSTFTVTLPFDIDTNHTSNGLESLMGYTILLAEDNMINMEIAKGLLEEKGAKIIEAHDGKEAVENFSASREGSIDLVLMDVMMPNMNGLEATRAIRSLKRGDIGVPIIALTANAFKDDILAVYDAGMNDYMTKPFDISQLMKRISGFKR